MVGSFRRLMTAIGLTVWILAATPQPVWTQDDSQPKTPEAAPAANPTKEAPDNQPAAAAPATEAAAPADAAPAPAAAEAVDPAAAAQAFATKIEEWKTVLKDMRALKTEYDEADPSQFPAIQERWNTLVAQGESLIDDLRSTGRQAYAAAPESDRELTRFLIKVLQDDVEHDRYEVADKLAKTMLEAGSDSNEVLAAGGMAAFCVNDMERAEKYLTEAQSRGSLSDDAAKYFSLVQEYKTYWAEEQAIRQKEAEANDLPRVKITTNKGEMVIELFENEAPETVGNFISLVEKKFYDGLTFHRVLPGFMAQGGCPLGTGSGGPGYNIYCECFKDNFRKHFRGTLSMAHAGKDTGGSQFFITFVPTAHLNGRHTAFGRVIEGIDVLAKLQRIDPQSKDEKPQPDKIVSMEVLRKRDHEYVPNKVQ